MEKVISAPTNNNVATPQTASLSLKPKRVRSVGARIRKFSLVVKTRNPQVIGREDEGTSYTCWCFQGPSGISHVRSCCLSNGSSLRSFDELNLRNTVAGTTDEGLVNTILFMLHKQLISPSKTHFCSIKFQILNIS